MSLADEVRTVQQRVAARLRELEPLAREYEELKQLAAELGLEAPSAATSTAAHPEAPAAPRATRSRRRPSGAARRQPLRGRQTLPADAGGELAERVLAAVDNHPGRTVAEYAATLEVDATSLYRPVRKLTADGRLVKRARQLFPA